jgi:hypothetical protein
VQLGVARGDAPSESGRIEIVGGGIGKEKEGEGNRDEIEHYKV